MKDSLAGVLPPSTLGRYEIIDRLGAGGMGEVLLARHRGAAGFIKAVALKRILPQFSADTDFKRHLHQEAALAALLHHPNCVQVLELEEIDGDLIIAMELMYGASLAELMTKLPDPLPCGVAVRIGADAARGLAYVHELEDADGSALNVVHRDVSPQNLFVTDGGTTKVIDFGIAKAIELLDGDTRTGVLKGKYGYMAPEQTTAGTISGRTDVWGLGVTLWEMLAGCRLFGSDSILEALEAIRSGPLVAPSDVRPEVPPELDRLVMDALRRSPQDRPSAAVLAQRLEEIGRGFPDATQSDVATLVKRVAGQRIRSIRRMVSSPRSIPAPSSGERPLEGLAPLDEDATPPPESTTRPLRRAVAAPDGSVDPFAATDAARMRSRGQRRWLLDALALAVGAAFGLFAHWALAI